MKKKFEKIWKLALTHQDKRRDEGHAETVLGYASKLIKIENAGNENVIIPAAILHDIGWSRLSKKERLSIFRDKLNKEDKGKIQRKHEKIGTKLAENILKKANYILDFINEILEIISQHDTRKGFIAENEGIVRDADKLWRFSKKGFWTDTKRYKIIPERYYEKLKAEIDFPNFFYSKNAKNIARQELKKRKNELFRK